MDFHNNSSQGVAYWMKLALISRIHQEWLSRLHQCIQNATRVLGCGIMFSVTYHVTTFPLNTIISYYTYNNETII